MSIPRGEADAGASGRAAADAIAAGDAGASVFPCSSLAGADARGAVAEVSRWPDAAGGVAGAGSAAVRAVSRLSASWQRVQTTWLSQRFSLWSRPIPWPQLAHWVAAPAPATG